MEEKNGCVTQILGKQSISFAYPVYIQGCAAIVGKKEGEGPLGRHFDEAEENCQYGSRESRIADGRYSDDLCR